MHTKLRWAALSTSYEITWRQLVRRKSRKTLIAVVGGLVLLFGIITIPYPGPGWLIVFAGLGILASEFAWAHRLLRFARERYDRFMAWFVRQSIVVKALSALLTCAIVIGTLWVLGTLGLIAGWVG